MEMGFSIAPSTDYVPYKTTMRLICQIHCGSFGIMGLMKVSIFVVRRQVASQRETLGCLTDKQLQHTNVTLVFTLFY